MKVTSFQQPSDLFSWNVYVYACEACRSLVAQRPQPLCTYQTVLGAACSVASQYATAPHTLPYLPWSWKPSVMMQASCVHLFQVHSLDYVVPP